MSLEIILKIEPLDIHIKKLGLIAYKRLERKLDKVTWCTDPTKSHLQYWAQDLHSVITKTADDRCDTTIYDRFAKINTESFDGKPINIQKAETTRPMLAQKEINKLIKPLMKEQQEDHILKKSK